MKIDRQEYLDKVYACWVGKNIGGTMGGPYEWVRDMVDCQGFTSPKGEPLPNDDLDLQLVWLRALENYGVRSITPQLLGEYWLEYVTGSWNEYGIAKGNLRAGLLPPYSGEYDNGKWRIPTVRGSARRSGRACSPVRRSWPCALRTRMPASITAWARVRGITALCRQRITIH